ncbi:MAG: YicC family protein [Planctomycetes bacterium]|nr:YicC family protein [Planctomycetota bacterium]
MTGSAWGRHGGEVGRGAYVVELRSLNGRGLTAKFRLPYELVGCERGIEERLRARLARGTVFVTVARDADGEDPASVIDPHRFAAAASHLAELARKAGLATPTVRDVLIVPGVLATQGGGRDVRDGPTDDAPPELLAAVDAVIGDLVAAREAEGATLVTAIVALLSELERGIATVAKRAPLLAERYRDKLLLRVKEILDANGARLTPADVVQQVALYADKADITEELERLQSHVARARAMLGGGGSIGRPLEFLIQEMLREVNTIGSKSPDVEIAHEVVSMKTTVDRLKEQVANLE